MDRRPWTKDLRPKTAIELSTLNPQLSTVFIDSHPPTNPQLLVAPKSDEGGSTLNSSSRRSQTKADQLLPPRLLVLGLGNDLLRDDSIGLRLTQALSDRLSDGSNPPRPPERERAGVRALGVETNITILQSAEAGLALLDLVADYDELIIVDAVQTGHAEPGHVHELEVDQMQLISGGSPHFLGIAEMLALGRELHLPVPGKTRIFAIEVEDPYTLEQGLTPALSAAFPRLVAALEQTIRATPR